MPKHVVNMNMPKGMLVINADVDFVIKADGTKMGTLKISRGAVEWLPVGNSKKSYTMTWEQFASVMKDGGWEKRRP